MFSPLAFGSGMIVFELSTSLPPSSQLALSPFELHRAPLAIIAIADGIQPNAPIPNGHTNGSRPTSLPSYIRELDQQLEAVRDQYPNALVHQLFIFDHQAGAGMTNLPEGLIGIPSVAESRTTTMKTVMCDLSSMLLAEMTTLAKSYQGRTMIESPNQAQTSSHSNGYSWGGSEDWSRRGSVHSISEQSDSSGRKDNRSSVRMSMPAVLRRTPSGAARSDSTSRPTTPNGVTSPEPISPKSGQLPRGNTEAFRDHSRDRISVQGFGSGSPSEMARNKAKGRMGIVLGSMYLQAGRWNDSLRECAEAAQLAKTSGDHLWHAKGLEIIMVSMFMIAWVGLDFQVPQICYASAEKSPFPSSTPATSDSGLTSDRLVSLSNLAAIIPELLAKVLHLYERSSNREGESLPQLAFSESAIRFSKILAVMHLAGGQLNDDVLQHMICGRPLPNSPNARTPRLNIQPSRSSIIVILFRAFPSVSAAEDLSVIDRTIILGGIASVLGDLGYHRKKAMVMRELIAVIMPGLIHARIAGAAEIGVHPGAAHAVNGAATGLAALELGAGAVEDGVDRLLRIVAQIYGVVSWDVATSSEHGQIDANDDSTEAVIARIMRHARLRLFGGQYLKMNVLRACIDLLEALPDHRGILAFCGDLLRTAGSGVAPGSKSLNAAPAMSREEQLRLTSSVHRYAVEAKKLGLENLAAEYWDEFLVRGIELEAPPQGRTPIPHQPSELGSTMATETKERNPFIYNPFLRRPDATADRLLIANETAVFKVSLQNPYDVDLEIDSIKLQSDGIAFNSAVQRTTIGPYRTQVLSALGTPKETGVLNILGCYIKVRGCRERRFPIFVEPWAPVSEVKIKTIGLELPGSLESNVRPVTPTQKPAPPEARPPKATSLTVSVIPQQPVIIVRSSTLAQSAVMILEGETQRFSVTLENLSESTAADLVLFSFQDSTQAPLQTALSNRDASPAELYEYELILLRKQALKWIRGVDPARIEPRSTATFQFEILGKPGLTNCSIQVDYCFLGKPAADVKEKFHTRQVSMPITVTVNASVELARVDVLPLTAGVPQSLWPQDVDGTLTSEDFCLLLLDLRNAWPGALRVQLAMADDQSVDEDILPGQTSRIMFPIRRILLDDPYASIPALDASRQRQFVVSTGRVTADSERASREMFWYREAILKSLSGSWSTVKRPKKSGDIELRSMRLSHRMIEAIRGDVASIDISIDAADSRIQVNEFHRLTVRIRNRSHQPIDGLLRIQPVLRNQLHSLAVDVSKKLAWDGVLQSSIPTIPAHDETSIVVGVTALARGEYDISACVEEIKLQIGSDSMRSTGEGGQERPRANTKTMMDAILGNKERRIWHTREPFVLFAVDDHDSEEELDQH